MTIQTSGNNKQIFAKVQQVVSFKCTLSDFNCPKRIGIISLIKGFILLSEGPSRISANKRVAESLGGGGGREEKGREKGGGREGKRGEVRKGKEVKEKSEEKKIK